MKNIKLVLLIVLAAGMMFQSCTDNWLEEDVFDFKTDDNFFKTPEDANLAMIGTYKYLADLYRISMIEMLTQNSGAFTKGKKSTAWMTGAYTPATKEINSTWLESYTLINACNDIIYRLNRMEGIDSTFQKSIIAEARFLRGWSYFNLVRIFRRVPIKLEPTSSIDKGIMVGLDSADVIYNKVIIPDLEFAKTYLPESRLASNTGRVTKGTAAAALSKVYITMAGTDYNSGYWVKARDEAKWVIDNCSYELVSDFGDLWDDNNKNTKESIFEVQYIRNINTGSGYAKIFTPSGSRFAAMGGGWGRSRCTQKNYDDFRNSYPGDYRLEKTFLQINVKGDSYNGYIRYKNTANGLNIYPIAIYPTYVDKKFNYQKSKEYYPYVGKWKDPDAVDNFNADNNFIVIRYADVLLMFAEAENEVNGPSGEAYDAIDMILDRARNADGTPREQPADWERTMSKEEFRDKVWNERRFELLGELQLWFDLVRKGWDKFRTFKEEDNEYGDKEIKHGIYEKNMYYPIPTLEISANDAISVEDQNPGY